MASGVLFEVCLSSLSSATAEPVVAGKAEERLDIAATGDMRSDEAAS